MTLETPSSPASAASSLSDSAPDMPADPLPTYDALPPGTRLEEFVIERMIGASGFGIVYLATDQAFQRRVAIKEYLPIALASRSVDGAQVRLRAPDHAAAFERGRRAFIDESQLLARLDHPSLLHVLRSWEANGTAYRAMPYHAGHSLLALRHAMDQPPDEASLRALLEGLLGALEAIHGAGRVHREVTPSNILLMPDDHPVLLDGGAARRAIVGEQTQALMTLLEPTFAPMEQIAPSSRLPQGPWTDLYALAATVHYCVSGRLPGVPADWFPESHEPLAEAVQRLQNRFPTVHYSKSFLAAIDAALAMRPRDRPQSVAQFRAALDERPTAARVEPALPHEPPADTEPEFAPMPPVRIAPAVPLPPTPSRVRSQRLARESQQRRAKWTTAALVLLVFAALGWMLTEQDSLADAQAAFDGIVKDLGWPAPRPAATSLAPAAPRTAVATAPVAAPVAPAAVAAVAAPASQAAPLELPEAPTAAVGPVVAPTASPAPAVGAAPKASAKRRSGSARSAAGPRQICAGRTQFALYRCMQNLCAQPKWSQNAQCKRLRARDEVVEG